MTSGPLTKLLVLIIAHATTSAAALYYIHRTVFLQYSLISEKAPLLQALRAVPGIALAATVFLIWRQIQSGSLTRTARIGLAVVVGLTTSVLASLAVGVATDGIARLASWDRALPVVLQLHLLWLATPWAIATIVILPWGSAPADAGTFVDAGTRVVAVWTGTAAVWLAVVAVDGRFGVGSPPGGGYAVARRNGPVWDPNERAYLTTYYWGPHRNEWTTTKIDLDGDGRSECIVEVFEQGHVETTTKDPADPSERRVIRSEVPTSCRVALSSAARTP